MSTWDERDLKDDVCPSCGVTYHVKYKELPLKDTDDSKCSCGHVMRAWRETGMYTYRLASTPNS